MEKILEGMEYQVLINGRVHWVGVADEDVDVEFLVISYRQFAACEGQPSARVEVELL